MKIEKWFNGLLIASAVILIANFIVWLIVYQKIQHRNDELEQINRIQQKIIDRYNLKRSALTEYINERAPDRPAGEMAQAILKYSADNNLEPELVTAVIEVESGFNSLAESRKKLPRYRRAKGLMQLMDDTAKAYDCHDVWSWRENMRCGCQYLGDLKKRFGDINLALCAYNSGPSWPREKMIAYAGKYPDKVNRGMRRMRR